MNDVVIDFRAYEGLVTDFVNESVRKFLKKKPKVQIALIGVQGDPCRGTAEVYFSTKESSDEFVESFADSSDAELFIGEDEFGRFVINCENFGTPGWFGMLELPDFPFLQDTPSKTSIVFVSVTGQKTRIEGDPDGRGDEHYYPPLFSFLESECQRFDPPASLNHADVTRLGVQIYEGGLASFWPIFTPDD